MTDFREAIIYFPGDDRDTKRWWTLLLTFFESVFLVLIPIYIIFIGLGWGVGAMFLYYSAQMEQGEEPSTGALLLIFTLNTLLWPVGIYIECKRQVRHV